MADRAAFTTRERLMGQLIPIRYGDLTFDNGTKSYKAP